MIIVRNAWKLKSCFSKKTWRQQATTRDWQSIKKRHCDAEAWSFQSIDTWKILKPYKMLCGQAGKISWKHETRCKRNHGDQSLEKPDSSTETPPGKWLQQESKNIQELDSPQTLNGSILNHSNFLKLQGFGEGIPQKSGQSVEPPLCYRYHGKAWRPKASSLRSDHQRPMEPATDDLFSDKKLGPIATGYVWKWGIPPIIAI